jgi:hypothetical protein
MRLCKGIALAFLLASSPAMADDVSSAKTQRSTAAWTVLGQKWCIGDVPAETVCDFRMTPKPAAKPATSASMGNPRTLLNDLLEDLRRLLPKGDRAAQK